jgi:hypothetical protein
LTALSRGRSLGCRWSDDKNGHSTRSFL